MRKVSKRLLALLLALCLTAGLAFPASASWWEEPSPFEDLEEWPYEWPVYCDFINRALELGIFSGTSATTFSPDKPITRAQAVTALAKTHQAITGEAVSVSGSAPFSDVPSGSWYGRYVSWAYENGLVSGTGNSTFSPGRLVSYAELGVMFHRYLQMMELDQLYDPVPGDWSRFPAWAQKHLEAISGFKIISPSDIEFSPVSRWFAADHFVQLYEKATFPVDKKTERVKYVYYVEVPLDVESAQSEDKYNSFTAGDYTQVLTSYEEYARLLADLQKDAKDFTKERQTPDLTIREEDFADSNLLAIELVRPGSLAYNAEFGGISIEDGAAHVSFTSNGTGGCTAEVKGILFLVRVPKDVTDAELTFNVWTDIFHWNPG